MQSETCRPVIDYEDSYEVSSYGRARSIDRIVQQGTRTFHVRSCILQPMIQRRSGGHIVALADHGKRRRYYVHRLMTDVGFPNAEIFGLALPSEQASAQ